jgi:hypothetical protein
LSAALLGDAFEHFQFGDVEDLERCDVGSGQPAGGNDVTPASIRRPG